MFNIFNKFLFSRYSKKGSPDMCNKNEMNRKENWAFYDKLGSMKEKLMIDSKLICKR